MKQDGVSKVKAEIRALSYIEMIVFARDMGILIGGAINVIEAKGNSAAPTDTAPAIAEVLVSWVLEEVEAEQVIDDMKREYWRENSILHPGPLMKLTPPNAQDNITRAGSSNEDVSSKGRVLISLAEIKKMGISFSRPHIYDLMKSGKFPRPIKIGSRKNAWVKSEIESWIADRASERKK